MNMQMTNDMLHCGYWAAVDELVVKDDHDDSAVGRKLFQDAVGDVAGVIAHRKGARMREDDRSRRHVQCVLHSCDRHVRQIHQHPQTVHLSHHQLQ